MVMEKCRYCSAPLVNIHRRELCIYQCGSTVTIENKTTPKPPTYYTRSNFCIETETKIKFHEELKISQERVMEVLMNKPSEQDPATLEKIERLKKVNGGVYASVIETLKIKKACFDCHYFVPRGQGLYKCCVPGRCIAATLTKTILKQMLKELDLWEE